MTDRLKYSYEVDLTDANTAATKIIGLVGERRRVLEVGAGPGSISRILKTRCACDVTAIEIDDAAIRELETFCDRVFQVDLNDPKWPEALADVPPFQFVIAADVLEHLLDPLAVLVALKRLLADDGRLIVSLPNVAHNALIACLLDDDFRYGEWGLLDRTHIRFFGPKNIDEMFAAAELRIVTRDHVLRQPGETEFSGYWDRLPADLRESLSWRSTGTVYQTVVLARPATDGAIAARSESPVERGSPVTRTDASLAMAEPPPGAALPTLMLSGNALLEAGQTGPAQRVFERAIAEYGENFDALHLLGVIHLQKGKPRRALHYLLKALGSLTADFPPYFRNLGLCLAAIWRSRTSIGAITRDRVAIECDRIYRSASLPPLAGAPPLVTVVLTLRDRDAGIDAAIESIRRQTCRNLELVVVDDGARPLDGALEGLQADSRVLRRSRAGLHHALNEGVAAARGRYVALLEGNDCYTPERVELLVRMLAASGARWGLTNVAFADAAGRPVRYGERPDVDAIMGAHESLLGCSAVSEGVMQNSRLAVAGNLFFERALWQEVGGFKPMRHVSRWVFSLGASLLDEPAYLDEPVYIHRVGAASITDEEERARRAEEWAVEERWFAHLDGLRSVPNPRIERARELRRQHDFAIMANGAGHLLDRNRLLRYVAELKAEASASDPQDL